MNIDFLGKFTRLFRFNLHGKPNTRQDNQILVVLFQPDPDSLHTVSHLARCQVKPACEFNRTNWTVYIEENSENVSLTGRKGDHVLQNSFDKLEDG